MLIAMEAMVTRKFTRTIEEYQKRIDEERDGFCEALTYDGSTRKMAWHKCNTCGYEWETTPGKILHRGDGCKKCSNRFPIKTIEDYQIRIDEERNGFAEVLSYGGSIRGESTLLCRTCSYKWTPQVTHILHRGDNCPQCTQINLINDVDYYIDYYQRRIDNERKSFATVIGYTNIKYRVLSLQCKTCTHKWNPKVSTILNRGDSCPNCSKRFHVKTIEDYQRRIDEERNGFCEVVRYGGNTKNKAVHRCRTCDNKWETFPTVILHQLAGCPECSATKNATLIKEILREFVSNGMVRWGVRVGTEVSFPELVYKRPLKFDLCVEGTRLFIESDGEQHYKPVDFFGGEEGFEETQIRDNIKNQYIIERDLLLVRIRHQRIYERFGEAGLRLAVELAVDEYHDGGTGVWIITDKDLEKFQ